jgi:hypothetical protein
MQKGLKALQVLSTGDKTKKVESLYAQEIACYARRPTAEFRINTYEINMHELIHS